MSPDLTAYLPLILIALVALVLAAWILTRMGRKARVIDDESGAPMVRDVLAEGAAPAARNQALIDAPRVIETIPVPPAAPSPVAASTAAAADSATAPLATPATPAAGSADDLTRIKGLGPKIAVLLGDLGITSFAQIAGWDAAEVERIDAQLGRFAGRITRDQWVEQARLLAAGDETGFAAQFGRNG